MTATSTTDARVSARIHRTEDGDRDHEYDGIAYGPIDALEGVLETR